MRLRVGREAKPGMDRLIEAAELVSERLLHYARLLLWVVLVYVIFVHWNYLAYAPAFVTVGAVLGGALGWTVLWFYLARARYHGWLKYATITLDVLLLLRLLLAFSISGDFATRLPEAMSAEELASLFPLALAVVVVSGAFRYSRLAVAYATALSLGALAIAASFAGLDPRVWTAQAALLLAIGCLSVIATGRLRVIALRAREEELLEGYVSPALIHDLVEAKDPNQLGRLEVVSVLFADVRGYTTIAEALTPPEAIAFLNRYFAAVVAPVVERAGVVDKYIGDGLLAFFEGEEHAGRAVAAARAMLRAVDRLNEAPGARPPLRIGVAVHSGPALIGTIGAAPRREYTVIGDTVNVASRLEELNKTLGTSLLISSTTRALVRNLAAERQPRTMPIRGRAEPVEVYALA